jgi:hypothetical protein
LELKLFKYGQLHIIIGIEVIQNNLGHAYGSITNTMDSLKIERKKRKHFKNTGKIWHI